MSPEQAVMTQPGHRHAQRHLQPGRAALRIADRQDAVRREKRLRSRAGEMRRTIREEEPARPRRAEHDGERRADRRTAKRAVAWTRRGAEFTLLRGDLDWIVMKCLEKDRARRYETANGLARGHPAAPEQRTGGGPSAEHGLSCPEIRSSEHNAGDRNDGEIETFGELSNGVRSFATRRHPQGGEGEQTRQFVANAPGIARIGQLLAGFSWLHSVIRHPPSAQAGTRTGRAAGPPGCG